MATVWTKTRVSALRLAMSELGPEASPALVSKTYFGGEVTTKQVANRMAREKVEMKAEVQKNPGPVRSREESREEEGMSFIFFCRVLMCVVVRGYQQVEPVNLQTGEPVVLADLTGSPIAHSVATDSHIYVFVKNLEDADCTVSLEVEDAEEGLISFSYSYTSVSRNLWPNFPFSATTPKELPPINHKILLKAPGNAVVGSAEEFTSLDGAWVGFSFIRRDSKKFRPISDKKYISS